MEVEICLNNGFKNSATLTTLDCTVATRVFAEFMDIMRYEQDVEFICIKWKSKEDAAKVAFLSISLLSHTEVIVNGAMYPFIDAVDMVTNQIAELWED